MQPTVEDLRLLKRIYVGGQSVHVEGNVDQRPYKRLEDIGWLTSTALSMQDVAYKMTEKGLKQALDLD
ncbi:hypothetical protein [Bradyrhizobium septentrionale]|uniref:Uncharacterized protein n=1 Tax=Bradyrhizobium septentrionale TaxID=1404411 RepID=A0ABZ2P7V0_9BRAD